jgi:hypothetical protein
MKYKNKILELRLQGLSYNKIAESLGCAKSTVCFHCQHLEGNKETIRNLQGCLEEPMWDEKTKDVICWLRLIGVCIEEIADVLEIDLVLLRWYVKKHFLKRGTRNIENYKRVRNRRRKLKVLAVLTKGGCCQRCGYDTCIKALDLHHYNGEKDFSISTRTNTSWQAIKKEVEKCILLCSNCHREIHAGEWNINDLKKEISSDLKWLEKMANSNF